MTAQFEDYTLNRRGCQVRNGNAIRAQRRVRLPVEWNPQIFANLACELLSDFPVARNG